MFRSTIALCLLALAIVMSACAVPVDAPEDLAAEPESLAMEKKKLPAPVAPLSADGSSCKVTADCMPTAKECGVAACVDGTCMVVAVAKDLPCQGGVGLCDGAGVCEKVTGTCKGWDGSVLRPCDADAECDDGGECTVDTCQAGWCHHAPKADGQACGGGTLSCHQGLCCVPS